MSLKMEIMTIAVSYGWTESLPGDASVQSGITYTAALDPGEDFELATTYLQVMAKDEVERQVDAALEQADQPPRFFNGQRWVLWSADQWVLVLPRGTIGPEHTRERRGYEYQYRPLEDSRGYTLNTALRLAHAIADSAREVIHCKGGIVPQRILEDLETVVCTHCETRVPWLETEGTARFVGERICAACHEALLVEAAAVEEVLLERD